MYCSYLKEVLFYFSLFIVLYKVYGVATAYQWYLHTLMTLRSRFFFAGFKVFECEKTASAPQRDLHNAGEARGFRSFHTMCVT